MTASGYKQSVYWGNETAYGSAATVSKPFGLIQSINPTETNNLIKVRTLGGTRDYSNIVPGKFEVSGSFEYFMQTNDFLRQAIGEDTGSTATVDSGPAFHTGAATYLHVLGSAESPTTDSFPSFTMEFADSEDAGGASSKNLTRTYDGCRVNTLSISAAVDEPVKIACDFIAQGVTMSTADATSVTDSVLDPYVFYQGLVTATSGGIVSNTAVSTTDQIAEVNNFTFSVNNNLEPIWYVSGTTSKGQTLRSLKNLVVKGRDYEASLGLHFADKGMYQRFLGSNSATEDQSTLSKYQIALDFVRSGTIGSDPKLAADRFIRIVLGSCAFDNINISGAPEDLVSQDINVAVEKAKIYTVDAVADYST